MKFRFIKGKNNRDFVVMEDIMNSPPPFKGNELYNSVKTVLERKEYKPFMTKSFDKYIRASYLFNGNIFPYTLWQDVCNHLNKLGIKNVVLEDEPKNEFSIDRNEFDEWLKNVHIPENMKINDDYDFQPDSVFNALNRRTARIMVATSGGKTFITYLYCRYLIDHKEKLGINKILIIVPSKLLCKQLQDDFKEYDVWYRDLNHEGDELFVSTIYSGSKQISYANVICGTYQSLCEYDQEYFDEFQVVVCDELHRAKAYSIRNGIYAKCVNVKFFFGMTGSDPDYKTLDYLHITSMFGPEVVRLEAADAIKRGISNNIIINQIEIEYFRGDKKITNISDVIDVPEDEENKSATSTYFLEKDFFQSNKDRLNIITRFINKFRETSIILVDTVEYCHTVADYIAETLPDVIVEIIHGQISDKERNRIIDEARSTTENYVIVATYGTMSTGTNIKTLTNLYIIDGGKSQTRIRQSAGRIMRIFEGKHKSRVFDLKDCITRSSFYRQARERESIYKERLGLEVKKYKTRIDL